MKFKLRVSFVLIILLPLLAGTASFASPDKQNTIPILPYPRHSQQTTQLSGISLVRSLNVNSLPADIQERLRWHWSQFTNGRTASGDATVRLILLGSDKKIDQEVAQLAGKWMDQIGKEGYVLVLQKNKRLIAANTEAGLFYGMQSLKQLIRAKWNKELVVTDWPMLPYRVIYDDISRGPISTVAYIKQQIERMAELKINGLSFYIEHIVQPVSRPDFAPENGKLTIAQIKELSAYARKFHMELIGSFQSFGHFEKILALPQYTALGATSTLISPTNKESKKFLEDVIGELCDAFDSPYFNVNCDETFDLGQGNTKPDVEKIGEAAYYANHLRFLYDIVRSHGKKMMMWGDFVLEHQEVLDLLPKDITYLTWEYGDQHSYDHWIKPFADRGLSYMVCPGILNSYRMFPDMVMAKTNIAGFIDAGQRNGAKGAITTIWDDGGTYLFSADWYGVYAAAEKSWNTDTSANKTFDIRYSKSAYGSEDLSYVKALFKLMELRSLPLTYNLNDRLWQQKVLPDKGRKLIINNSDADAALKILHEATELLRKYYPQRHQSDLSTLKFSIGQYRTMIDSRKQVASFATQYKKALAAENISAKDLKMDLDALGKSVGDLIVQYKHTRDVFEKAWLAENQLYWLDVILGSYDKKINDLTGLQKDIKANTPSDGLKPTLPPAESLRLSIEESNDFYFPNWMVTGPFPMTDKDSFPSFLYSDNTEYNKAPSPGDFTQYLGKMYRWRKFASTDGGIVYLNDLYAQTDTAFVYAYCSLTSGQDTTVQAFVGGDAAYEVYCNGIKTSAGSNSSKSTASTNLALKKGINYILIKLRKTGDNSFSFRLQSQLNVTNSKHKYQVNVKKKLYDAE